jgi:hypothetical protein
LGLNLGFGYGEIGCAGGIAGLYARYFTGEAWALGG